MLGIWPLSRDRQNEPKFHRTSLLGRPNRERSYQRRELLSLNQLCQRNCCGLRAEPCEITTLTRAGPRKLIASSRAPRRSFGSFKHWVGWVKWEVVPSGIRPIPVLRDQSLPIR